MRRNTLKRILACLLALALALSCSPVVDAAGASQAGQLVLAVITQEQVVIEPTSVSLSARGHNPHGLKKLWAQL